MNKYKEFFEQVKENAFLEKYKKVFWEKCFFESVLVQFKPTYEAALNVAIIEKKQVGNLPVAFSDKINPPNIDFKPIGDVPFVKKIHLLVIVVCNLQINFDVNV